MIKKTLVLQISKTPAYTKNVPQSYIPVGPTILAVSSTVNVALIQKCAEIFTQNILLIMKMMKTPTMTMKVMGVSVMPHIEIRLIC